MAVDLDTAGSVYILYAMLVGEEAVALYPGPLGRAGDKSLIHVFRVTCYLAAARRCSNPYRLDQYYQRLTRSIEVCFTNT